jgi:epsilon-lactone hydrolase
MPSQAMQDAIDARRERRKDSAGQPPPTLEQCRAAFTPGDWLYPVPDDVLVTEATAGGVPAHWLAAPGTDPGRMLLFLHGGGYELGSLRSDGELAARLGRAAGMRVLFPEYWLAPEHPFPAAIDDVLAAWRWLRTGQDLSAPSLAVAGDSAGGGLAVALLVATRGAGEAGPAAAVLMSPTVDLTSSGASSANRTVHSQQVPRRPARPLAAQRPESLLITSNGARRKAPPNKNCHNDGEAHDRPAGLTRRAELRA